MTAMKTPYFKPFVALTVMFLGVTIALVTIILLARRPGRCRELLRGSVPVKDVGVAAENLTRQFPWPPQSAVMAIHPEPVLRHSRLAPLDIPRRPSLNRTKEFPWPPPGPILTISSPPHPPHSLLPPPIPPHSLWPPPLPPRSMWPPPIPPHSMWPPPLPPRSLRPSLEEQMSVLGQINRLCEDFRPPSVNLDELLNPRSILKLNSTASPDPHEQDAMPHPHKQDESLDPREQDVMPHSHEQDALPCLPEQDVWPHPHKQDVSFVPHKHDVMPHSHEQDALPCLPEQDVSLDPHKQDVMPHSHEQDAFPHLPEQDMSPHPHKQDVSLDLCEHDESLDPHKEDVMSHSHEQDALPHLPKQDASLDPYEKAISSDPSAATLSEGVMLDEKVSGINSSATESHWEKERREQAAAKIRFEEMYGKRRHEATLELIDFLKSLGGFEGEPMQSKLFQNIMALKGNRPSAVGNQGETGGMKAGETEGMKAGEAEGMEAAAAGESSLEAKDLSSVWHLLDEGEPVTEEHRLVPFEFSMANSKILSGRAKRLKLAATKGGAEGQGFSAD